MTNAVWIRDVGAFSLQIAVVVMAGAAVARICRLRQPRAMLLFWRALLFVCLVLPFSQPWQTSSAVVVDPAVVPSLSAASVAAGPGLAVPTARSRSAGEMLTVLLVAGAGLRAIWLVFGALALRRLRLGAAPLEPLPPRIREAQLRVGARGDILVSDRASGPMTFGLVRPVILLPTDVRDMAPHIQEAIAYHELIHVQRRDWIDELFEEGVRTILWFHPAVWWLIERIRLSREQVVDEAVIRFTESREHYVDALLVVALRKSPVTLAPAPTFLRRSLLKRRVAHIMQETTMTTYRLIASLTTSAVVVGLAGVLAVRSFPLQAQAAAPGSVAAGDPVQVVRGADHLMHGRVPEYPERAIKQQVEGDVVLDVAVDDRGEVSDARVLTGPDELRRAALESVLQWHYSPTALRNVSTQVVLRFHLPPPEAVRTEGAAIAAGVLRFHPTLEAQRAFITTDGQTVKLLTSEPLEFESGEKGMEMSAHQRAERVMVEMREAIENPQTPPGEKEELKKKLDDMKREFEERHEEEAGRMPQSQNGPAQLARVRTERVADGMAGEILAKAGLSVGSIVSEESLKRIRMIASQADEHIRVEFGRDETGGVILTFITR
jgi:TonB family protein